MVCWLQRDDAATQVDEMTPLMDTIKKEAGEAVVAHMEERLAAPSHHPPPPRLMSLIKHIWLKRTSELIGVLSEPSSGWIQVQVHMDGSVQPDGSGGYHS